MIGGSPVCTTATGGQQKLVDVSSLFIGAESLFPDVIDSLYVGKLAHTTTFNQSLKAVYDNLELKVHTRFNENK